MTVHNVKTSVPPLHLPEGSKIVLEALDPSTGAAVAGVKVSQISVFGLPLEGADGGEVQVGPYVLVPGPTPVGNPGDGATGSGGQ